MITVPSGSPSPASADVILQWFADLLSSSDRLAEWQQLTEPQRSVWLSDEGYCASELQASLACFLETQGVDPALGSSMQRFLLHGESIPMALRAPLAALLLDRLQRLGGLAGGAQESLGLSLQSFVGPNLLADYRAGHSAAAKASRLLQEVSETHLGRYIEDVGGVEDKAAAHITHQIDTEALQARSAVTSMAAPVIALKDKEQTAYHIRKQHFITRTEDNAVTAESNQITKDKAARADGQHPLQPQPGKGGTYRPSLAHKEEVVVQDDRAYFEAHDLAALQAGLATKPSFSVVGQGSARSVTLTYDWDGSRASVQLDRATGEAELDPALGALNRLTAKALWSARQSAAIASWESQQWPRWQARLATAHPKVATQLATTVHTTFPKAKLPTSYSQFLLQGQAGAAALGGALQTRERRARRHGITLFSLQRQRDEKRLQQRTVLSHLGGSSAGRVHAADTALRAAVQRQLQAMALSVLVADVSKQLAASGQAQVLRHAAEAFAGDHATGLVDVQAQLAQSTTTLSVSDRDVVLSWTVGDGLQFSRSAQKSTAADSDDLTLSLQAQSKEDPQDSLRLSASVAPAGTLSTSFFRSRDDGTVVRQFSNTYNLSTTWQLRLQGGRAFGVAELQAYKASLALGVRAAALGAASAELQQHAASLQSHARLDALGRSVVKNAVTLHKALHDVRVDRRFESTIKPLYGSLRAQKLLLNQLQHDRASYAQAASMMRRMRNVKALLRRDAYLTIREWEQGVHVDQHDITVAKDVYITKPYSVEKKSSGHGYQLVHNGPYKDYWQKLTEKQRYAIFNPIYHSESIFYKSERTAFLAGVGEYTTLRRDGASKRLARLGASATYFNTLLREDGVLYKTGLATGKLAFAPFILRRQLHVAKRVVHLDRHPFAWRLRLSWKVKRERFIHKHVAAYEQYMLNHKFTGFHPFHRIANKSMNLIKSTWHYVLHPIVRRFDRITLGIISIFSPAAASWVAKTTTALFKTVKYIAYHAVKALWHLPEHLYHHTVYFGKQLLFAITHPWEYRRIWTGLKKDFRGIYRLAKFVQHLIFWAQSAFFRTLYQLGRWMTGNGANWSSIVRGAYHKKLWHDAKLLHDGWQFAGLATLIGKTKTTHVAIKVEMLRMQLRRDLHHDGFLVSPWRRFVRQHKSFITTQFDDIKPSQTAAVFAAYQRKRASLHGDEKALIKDYTKYKINASYRAAVQAKVTAARARAASFAAKLKPHVQLAMHTLSHDALKEISNVSHKSKKIKIWTLREYGLDISQLLWGYKRYRELGTLGRRELLLAIAAFRDLNRTHKTGVIKVTLQAYNAAARSKYKQWKKYFKTGTLVKGSYAYSVSQDWLNVGQQIGGQLLLALKFSIKSSSAKQLVTKDILHDHVGERVFDDIMGGFWLHHYEHNFAAKNSSLITDIQAERRVAGARLEAVEMVVSQPRVHKLLAYWLKRNGNSVIAKDVRTLNVFGRALEKKIHKWERIEKIGHLDVTEGDLLSLQSLHKSQLLGASLADAIARTSRWQELSLQQQAAYRTSYDSWITYNQTTYHGLDKSYSKFNQKDASEAAAWQSEQAEIASGETLTVGDLLVSVKTSDSRIGSTNKNGVVITWDATPKPPLANPTQHLEAAAANLASLAHDPRLLAVSVVTHAPDHSGTTPVKPTPSLFAYIMQIRHWYKKTNKILAKRKAKKAAAEAEAEAKKAKEAEAKAKTEAKADEAAAEKQVDTAKLQLEDGSKDRQQVAAEAKQDDASAVENLEADQPLDRVAKEMFKSDSGDPKQQLQQLDSGDIKASEQELQQAEVHEEDRLGREFREAADEDARVRDLQDALHVDRDLHQGDLKQDGVDEAEQLIAPEEKLVQKDLRDATTNLEAGAESDLESSLMDGSELLDQTVTDIEVDTKIVEEEGLEVEETVGKIAEDSLL